MLAHQRVRIESNMSVFGTEFCEQYALAHYDGESWQGGDLIPLEPLALHPAAHVFHYASTCFEGFKAYRWDDGSVHVFRLDDHVARMQKSAASLMLPIPDADLLRDMVLRIVDASRDQIPELPGALYLRPTLIGTLPNIGAAASPSTEAKLFVLASPVGDYFAGGMRPLKILIDDENARSTRQLGSTKTGGNYAAALGPTLAAKAKYGVDQVLFCPSLDVQETGAANFILIGDNRVQTKPLDSSFLHGITRASILQLAEDLGFDVVLEDFTVPALVDALDTHDAALSGTAASLTPIGTMIYRDKEYAVNPGSEYANTLKLRATLSAVHSGERDDQHGWLTRV
ncbi:MAG: branched-chain amino acid aminotransferase [Pseudomonadota bacterium]